MIIDFFLSLSIAVNTKTIFFYVEETVLFITKASAQ